MLANKIGVAGSCRPATPLFSYCVSVAGERDLPNVHFVIKLNADDACSDRLSLWSLRTGIRSGDLHKNGRRIRLQEKPCRVLIALAERPGEIILRTELRTGL
jgi:DNA-binding response OmpR family regulator